VKLLPRHQTPPRRQASSLPDSSSSAPDSYSSPSAPPAAHGRGGATTALLPSYRRPIPAPTLTSTVASDNSPPNPQLQPRHRAPLPPPALIRRSARRRRPHRRAPPPARPLALPPVTCYRLPSFSPPLFGLNTVRKKRALWAGPRASTIARPTRIRVSNMLTVLFLT
jgi:hypothetical protein